MIGLLIVTHEALGHAYTSLVTHFFNATPGNVRLLNVAKDDAPESILHRADELIREVDSGHGVLILTDIFGATPCNIARKLIHTDNVALITGLNAPMMVKAIQYSTLRDDVHAFCQEVKEAAISGILTVTHEPEEAT